MYIIRSTMIKGYIFWLLLLLFVISCSGSVPVTQGIPVMSFEPTEDLSGLSANAIFTLKSLEKVDDYPLYVMQYAGEYDYPQIGSAWLDEAGFGCSLFASLGDVGDKLFGRNFDWEYSPALLVFTNPVDGYASASMVDLTFLGITAGEAKTLTDLPLENRIALLTAPSLPFDGMNEYGLAIGMAAVPDEYMDDTSFDSSKPTIGSIGIIRQMLDHARDVDEALKIFGQYNIRFGGGPPIHYLLADSSGSAVLVEYYQGELIALPNENPYHLVTNHLRCIARGDGGCWRYRILNEKLITQHGQLDPGSAMQLLSQVKQDMTQWSAVYDMTSGDIRVVIAGDYDTNYTFHLDLLNP